MGSFMSRQLGDQLDNQKKFMAELSGVTMNRQVELQSQMRERMTSLQIARSREMFSWLASFYAVAVVVSIAGFRRSRKPAVVAPLLPLTFLVGYQADLAYGTKMKRIFLEADHIYKEERDLLRLPGGNVTLPDIDRIVEQLAEKTK
ncbi:plasminogen receptor (KT)-like [Symsagittifera roscoffensis]|uniref:plasminogen receptor (KT)-like n=1 Tax=Symsagittifera roscoffensis TaxID=84072 RepID=UPI00307BD883